MNIKKKLSLGLGFLFLIIFGLVFFGSFEVGKLSHDADNILKDNYQSVGFAKSMTVALEDMRTSVTGLVFNAAPDRAPSEYALKLFEGARAKFEAGLKSENNNITEINERTYADSLNESYRLFLGACLRVTGGTVSPRLYFDELQPAFLKVAAAINAIADVNMQAVERKNQLAKTDATRIISAMAAVGVLCLILAFAYFWYFPFFVSNSISHLAGRMKGLLGKAGLELDIRTNDEAHILLQGINLLENKLEAENSARERSRPENRRKRK